MSTPPPICPRPPIGNDVTVTSGNDDSLYLDITDDNSSSTQFCTSNQTRNKTTLHIDIQTTANREFSTESPTYDKCNNNDNNTTLPNNGLDTVSTRLNLSCRTRQTNDVSFNPTSNNVNGDSNNRHSRSSSLIRTTNDVVTGSVSSSSSHQNGRMTDLDHYLRLVLLNIVQL